MCKSCVNTIYYFYSDSNIENSELKIRHTNFKTKHISQLSLAIYYSVRLIDYECRRVQQPKLVGVLSECCVLVVRKNTR